MATKRLTTEVFDEKLYNQFPTAYRLDDIGQNYALKRYLQSAVEGGFKYIIEEQNGLLDLLDPRTAPIDVLYFLYEQYGLKLFHGIPEEFLRAFLPNLGLAYSKKGSIDVLEFIVSSLSGIKVTAEVTCDHDGNPYVPVRLDMDTTVSNYFPDIKQFRRILKSFLPFYCDTSLLFFYTYLEKQAIRGIDDFSEFTDNKIADTKTELACFEYGSTPDLSFEIDYHREHITYTKPNAPTEKGNIELFTDGFLNAPLTKLNESFCLSPSTHIDRIIYKSETIPDTNVDLELKVGNVLVEYNITS